ncbi:hypothetical protein [Ilumatobacter sp.]|uniref:hypothetical protein n=1 Tax=Ilumatobacter sp. TaxID=1967498 RepID=UPI003C31A012
MRRWFPPARGFRTGELNAVDGSVSLVLDDFMFTLYIGGEVQSSEASGTHDGAEFAALARDNRVDVYLTDGVDARRAKPEDLAAAAADGRLLAGSVAAFVVHTL